MPCGAPNARMELANLGMSKLTRDQGQETREMQFDEIQQNTKSFVYHSRIRGILKKVGQVPDL